MRRILLSLPFLLLTLSPAANAQTVSVPYDFTNGSPADANQVNANFNALESAVNSHDTRITAAQSAVNGISCATAADVVCNPSAVSCPACPSCPAAPACDTLDSFNQGAASVDITTDNAAVAAAAGNVACTQAGGTWEAGTSTCTASYNCFVGGFCAQAAIQFPPATYLYTNVYDGQSPETSGCDDKVGSDWNRGGVAGFEGIADFSDGWGAGLLTFFGPECAGCGGACTQDCAGTWGGSAVDDCNGVCGGAAVVDECGVCGGGGILDGYCDCAGNVTDCNGVCGGAAVVDECGVCGGACTQN